MPVNLIVVSLRDAQTGLVKDEHVYFSEAMTELELQAEVKS